MTTYSSSVMALVKLDNELDRFDQLCMLALCATGVATEARTPANRVVACDSNLWCVMKVEDNRLLMQVDSDSLYIKGLALLLREEVERRCLQQLSTAPLSLSRYLYACGVIDEKRRRGMLSMENKALHLAREALSPSDSYPRG